MFKVIFIVFCIREYDSTLYCAVFFYLDNFDKKKTLTSESTVVLSM